MSGGGGRPPGSPRNGSLLQDAPATAIHPTAPGTPAPVRRRLRDRVPSLGWRPDAYVRALWDSMVARVRGEADGKRLERAGVTIGRNVFINRSARFDGSALWLISVGDDSVIGPNVQILAHDATTRRRLGYAIVAPVRIGARVFVGAGSIILPGVSIGDDTIVGAGSVVRDDLPTGVLAVGNPVRIVSTTDEYLEGHRALIEGHPHWSATSWAQACGESGDLRSEMSDALSRGHGYVE